MKYTEITSRDNALIKKIIKLASDSSYRKMQKLAVISGKNLIIEALKHNLLNELLISRESFKKYAEIIEAHSSDKVYILDEAVISKINLVESHADIIGVVKIKASILDESAYLEDCLILENISDPGNLGTILRLSSATNIKNIIMSNNSTDAYSPKVLRSSAGIQFSLNIYTNVELNDFINKYQGSLLATTPHTDQTIYTMNLKTQIGWVFGNEGSGISATLLAKIKNKVSIPMPGNVESLNVAMAATVCLFEMVRQREYQ